MERRENEVRSEFDKLQQQKVLDTKISLSLISHATAMIMIEVAVNIQVP